MRPKDYQTKLTQERLKSLLNYEPETGVFTWRVWRPNGVKVGDEAGFVTAQVGYRRIKIDGHAYTASRLAWLYMTGDWPECLVDHKDTDKLNDAWINLRSASYQENSRNCGVQKNTGSGLKGVYLKKDAPREKRWYSCIRIDGVLKHIGYFETPEQANAAYAKAAQVAFGQFARS